MAARNVIYLNTSFLLWCHLFTNKINQVNLISGHCSFNHIVFIGMDVRTGEIVLLSEWTITNSKHLASLEQEFNYLTKLRHQNLIHYLNFKCENVCDGKIVVYILKEFINGPNCLFFMNENFSVNIQFVKYVAKGVLTALDYLHRNNVVHKDIRESCVYITEKGKCNNLIPVASQYKSSILGTVALSNYSLHRRLTDITSQSNSFTNYSKKTDIYKFGAFLVALLQGSVVSNDEDINIPTTVPPELHDFISRLAPLYPFTYSHSNILDVCTNKKKNDGRQSSY